MVERKRLTAKLADELIIEEIEGTRGPNTSYDPKYATIAKQLCARGATDSDLADAFQVATGTIWNWMSRFPGFAEAVRAGKAEIFDPKVERALALKAIGYSVDTEEVKITKDGEEVRYMVRKHYPPDTTACIFWLKNRQPTKWRDVWKIEHEGKMEIEKLSSEEVLKEIVDEAVKLGIPLQQLTAATGVVAPLSKTTNGKGTKH